MYGTEAGSGRLLLGANLQGRYNPKIKNSFRYGADLEVFIEKIFMERVTVRLVGQNLLNASKDEGFNKFASQQD